MRTRSPQSRGGAHVPAGPVRPSPDERPWRTMFAATVSAFCTPCANPRATCSGAQRAPQNADPFAAKPRRGTRPGRACTPLAHRTAVANNVRRYGLGILHTLRRNLCPCSGAHCAPQNADLFAVIPRTPAPRNRSGAHVPAARRGGAANGPRNSRTARDLVQCAQDPAPFVVRMANGETARAGARQAACGRAGAPARGGQSGPAGRCMPERVGCLPGAAIPARRGQKCPALSGCPGPAGTGRAAGCPEAPPECPAPCCRTPSTGTSPPPAAARPARRPPRCPGP